MSVLFGKVDFEGKPIEPEIFDRARPVLVPYGPDGERVFCKGNFGIAFHAFHTTKESRSEVQPQVASSGVTFTWDGRLDNRNDLIHQMRGGLSNTSTDLSIVLSAYERWGCDSFAKLVGDWALAIWDPRNQALVLAKDFVGTRHLYYTVENGAATWCSVLDPLILFADRALVLDEEYIAGWLSFFPAAHLTPYVGIHAVPPSSFVRLTKRDRNITKYWDLDPATQIRCRNDGEYEEGFRIAFAQAVKRRLRSDNPVLAELSGGMDSSSIVCMADNIIAQESGRLPSLDTISYYSDAEPNWNERPYFVKVEERRGRSGCHIDVSSENPLTFDFHGARFVPTPGSRWHISPAEDRLTDYMLSCGSRVVLSGIGGDEVTGGVPVPIPELADLLARAQFKALAHQLRQWALNKRRPWFHLLFETVRAFSPLWLAGASKGRHPPSWLRRDFVRRQKVALLGYETRTKLRGALPSFQEDIATLSALRRQLACDALPLRLPYEKRYPFLDRDLLEFLFAIPREQLVRPGERRSLMRRALAGLVPEEILRRRQKAFVSRGPRTAITSKWADLARAGGEMVSQSIGIVDLERLSDAVSRAEHDPEVPIITLARTLALEAWLRKVGSLLANIPPRPASNLSIDQFPFKHARYVAQRDSVHMD